MSKKRIFLKYDKFGKLVPKSLTISQNDQFPMGGSYVEILRQSCCCQNNLAEVVIGNLEEGSTIDDFINLLNNGGITFTNCTICFPTCTLNVSELGTNIGNYVLFGSVESILLGFDDLTNQQDPDFSLSLDCCPNIIASVETYLKYAETVIPYNLDLCCNNLFSSTETYIKYVEAFDFIPGDNPLAPLCGCPSFLGTPLGYETYSESPYFTFPCEEYSCQKAISAYETHVIFSENIGIPTLPDPNTSPLDYINYSISTPCDYTPSLQSCVLGLETTLGQTDLQALLDSGIIEIPGLSTTYSSCEIQDWLDNGMSFSDLQNLLVNAPMHLTQHSSKNIGEKITQLLVNDIAYSVSIPPNTFGITNILEKGIVQTGSIFDGKDVFYGIEDLRSFYSTLTPNDFASIFDPTLDRGIVEIGLLGGESIFYQFLESISGRTDLMSSAPPEDWITLLLNQGIKIQFADSCQITVSFIRDVEE
jgi:hypothetical protein